MLYISFLPTYVFALEVLLCHFHAVEELLRDREVLDGKGVDGAEAQSVEE